jgi:hypothetical protein
MEHKKENEIQTPKGQNLEAAYVPCSHSSPFAMPTDEQLEEMLIHLNATNVHEYFSGGPIYAHTAMTMESVAASHGR